MKNNKIIIILLLVIIILGGFLLIKKVWPQAQISKEASSVVKSNSMSDILKESFNSRFLYYQGKEIKGTEILQLLKSIESSNSDNERKVDVTFKGTVYSDNIEEINNLIEKYTKYNVRVSYDSEGYINNISID